MVAGLFALVLLCFCYDLPAAVGQDRTAKISARRNIERAGSRCRRYLTRELMWQGEI